MNKKTINTLSYIAFLALTGYALYKFKESFDFNEIKRILNEVSEAEIKKNQDSFINKAIEKTVEETKILVNQEEDPKKKIEISQKILGSNNVPVLQPVNGKPAEGAVVAQATQGNGRKKLG